MREKKKLKGYSTIQIFIMHNNHIVLEVRLSKALLYKKAKKALQNV